MKCGFNCGRKATSHVKMYYNTLIPQGFNIENNSCEECLQSVVKVAGALGNKAKMDMCVETSPLKGK